MPTMVASQSMLRLDKHALQQATEWERAFCSTQCSWIIVRVSILQDCVQDHTHMRPLFS